MLSSFEQHLQKTLIEKIKYSHWIMKFIQENLSCFSVMTYLNCHCASDIACADNAADFLGHPTINRPLHKVGDIADDSKGCYLYYDTFRLCFVCSGKVVGETRSFTVCGEKHKNASKVEKLASHCFTVLTHTAQMKTLPILFGKDTLKTCSSIVLLDSRGQK